MKIFNFNEVRELKWNKKKLIVLRVCFRLMSLSSYITFCVSEICVFSVARFMSLHIYFACCLSFQYLLLTPSKTVVACGGARERVGMWSRQYLFMKCLCRLCNQLIILSIQFRLQSNSRLSVSDIELNAKIPQRGGMTTWWRCESYEYISTIWFTLALSHRNDMLIK